MYRILAEAHDRNQIRRTGYGAPEVLSTQPNQFWSWDSTKLRGPATWIYSYVSVILDVCSRAVVGWMIAEREDAELAETLIAETCAKEGITPQHLTIHAGRRQCDDHAQVGQL